MDPITIFKATCIVKSIASYFGVIDSVSSNTKKLLHQSFKSAITNLDYAKNTLDETAQRDYLKQAVNEFIRAITVEENENLVSAYLGLSMCQYLLRDYSNARDTLRKIKDVSLSKSERTKAIAYDVSGYDGGIRDHNISSPLPQAMLWRGVKRTFGNKGNFERYREFSLEEYKENALSCLSYF